MKHTFSNFKEWKAAALAAGFVIERQYPTHEGPHEDDMYEPTFCGKYLPRTVECPEEESFQQYGMFSTDWSEDKKDSVCSGFFFDTYKEWEKEVEDDHQDWTNNDELVKLPESKTSLLDQIVKDCMGPTNELNAQPQDWPTAWRNGNDPD